MLAIEALQMAATRTITDDKPATCLNAKQLTYQSVRNILDKSLDIYKSKKKHKKKTWKRKIRKGSSNGSKVSVKISFSQKKKKKNKTPTTTRRDSKCVFHFIHPCTLNMTLSLRHVQINSLTKYISNGKALLTSSFHYFTISLIQCSVRIACRFLNASDFSPCFSTFVGAAC